MKSLLLLVAALVCAAQPQPLAKFRSDVQLINVGFTVRDAGGRLIENLTKDDFEIFEDGAPQKVAFFARSQDVPLNLGLVVDLSGSQAAFVKAHQKDMRVFLDRVLTPRDRALLVCFVSAPRLITEFTASGKQLVAALEGYQGVRDRAVYPLLGPPEIRVGGSAFYDGVYHTINQMLAPVDGGRKALIVFSDGEDNASAHNMMETIEVAQSSNVLVFGIRYTEVRNGRVNARNKYGTSVMARISKETGGADFDSYEKDLSEHFREIGDQLRQAYELGYHSTNPQGDGTFQKVTIKPKRPDLTVRAKTGYYAKP
jgi:Ca-activated chloride channel family protein